MGLLLELEKVATCTDTNTNVTSQNKITEINMIQMKLQLNYIFTKGFNDFCVAKKCHC